MVESLTKNYQWTKPEITKSAATWGGFLNTDLDSIDALVFANQQGIVPIGSIQMFGGATAPANWLVCDGSSLDTTTYAALFAVLQYAHGGAGASFNLPNLKGAFPLGAGAGSQINVGVGATGGEANHTLTLTETGAHHHNIADPTHAHGAYQNAHNHAIATGSHAHGITTGNHAHSGVFTSTAPTGGSFAPAAGAINLIQGNTSTAGNLGGNTDTAGNLGGNTDTQQPAIGVYGAATGISTTDTQGGGAPHNNVPPYVALNFIVRYQ